MHGSARSQATDQWRKSFLRRHIVQHIRPSLPPSGETGFGWDGRVGSNDPAGDILALYELRQSIYRDWRTSSTGLDASPEQQRTFLRRLLRLTLPEQFFFAYPDASLYRPVQIAEYRYASHTVPLRAADLSSLIRRMDNPPPPPVDPRRADTNWFRNSVDEADGEVVDDFEVIGNAINGSEPTDESRRKAVQQRPDTSHIVLTTRTGAGKTVACWKAFYDCLFPDPRFSPDEPLLKDYVPCWLRTPAGTQVDDALRRAFPELLSGNEKQGELIASLSHLRIPYLLALAANLVNDEWEAREVRKAVYRVQKYLTDGPKLLLFIDLNHVAVEARTGLAHSIAQFHSSLTNPDSARSWKRHRMVIAYRTTLAGTKTLDSDATLDRICHLDAARRFDLEPLRESDAVNYLRDVRSFERNVYEKLRGAFTSDEFARLPVWRDSHFPDGAVGLPITEQRSVHPLESPDESRWMAEVTIECELLRQLVRRTESSRESLISTPLLMHWVASLPAGRLPFVENVTHLYHEVVYQYLSRRDEQRNQHTTADLGRFQSLVGLTRVALFMLARDLRLSSVVVRDLLSRPLSSHERNELGVADSFWRLEDHCDEKGNRNTVTGSELQDDANELLTMRFSESQRQALLTFGLLRDANGQVGFLHDSLVYYFAGVLGLHHYRGPDVAVDAQVLPEAWPKMTAVRVAADPSRWAVAAEFLGGSLVPMQGLDSPFDRRPEVSRAAVTERRVVPGHRHRSLHDLIHHLLLAPPHPGLPGLLLRLLRGFGNDDQDFVVKALRLALIRRGRIESFTPAPKREQSSRENRRGDPLEHIEAFPAEQLAQDCFNFLYWIEKEPGPCHEFACRLLEPLRKVCRETGRRWLRQIHGPRPSLVQSVRLHSGGVTGIACLSDNRIVSTGEDGRVFRWDPESGFVELLTSRHGKILNLLIDAEDGVLYTDSEKLFRWNPATQAVETLLEGADGLKQVMLGHSRRTVFVSTKHGKVVGLNLSWQPGRDYDPWSPPQFDLGYGMDVDDLIPFAVQPEFESSPADDSGDSSRNSAMTTTVTDEVAIVDRNAGRILRGSVGDSPGMIQSPTELYVVPEDDLEIREAVFDQRDALLVNLSRRSEERSYEDAGIWHIPLTEIADSDARIGSRGDASRIEESPPNGWLSNFSFPSAPALVASGEYRKNGRVEKVRDVFRWNHDERRWDKVISFHYAFEPISCNMNNQVLLKRRGQIRRRRDNDLMHTVHFSLFDIATDTDVTVVSHLDRATTWGFDQTGTLLSGDTFGCVKRAVQAPLFPGTEPQVDYNCTGLLIDDDGNIVWCGTDWQVHAWFPLMGESETLATLKGLPMGLATFDDAHYALDSLGKLWTCRADQSEAVLVRDLSEGSRGDRITGFAMSHTGHIAWLTESVISGKVFRSHVQDDTLDKAHVGDGHHRLFIDTEGNVLIVGGLGFEGAQIWRQGQGSPTSNDEVQIAPTSGVSFSQSGDCFFAKQGGSKILRAYLSEKEVIVRWNPRNPETLEPVAFLENLVGPIAVSTDGLTVVSGEVDESLSRSYRAGRAKRSAQLFVHRSIRDPTAAVWASAVILGFRTDVSAVSVLPSGDALAASIDGTIQFSGKSGEKLRIETGQCVEWIAADPNRPVIAIVPHQHEMSVLVIEPDVADHEDRTLLPYRRDDRLGYLRRQLDVQLQAGAPAKRIERLLKAIAGHEAIAEWSAENISDALLPGAALSKMFPVLMNWRVAAETVASQREPALRFINNLIALLGFETESALSPRVRNLAHLACVGMGELMIEPLLAARDDRSEKYLNNLFLVLMKIVPEDDRIDALIDRLFIDELRSGGSSELSAVVCDVRQHSRNFLLDRLPILMLEFTNLDAIRTPAAEVCRSRWLRLYAAKQCQSTGQTLAASLPEPLITAVQQLSVAHAHEGRLSTALEHIKWLRVTLGSTCGTRSDLPVVFAAARVMRQFLRGRQTEDCVSQMASFEEYVREIIDEPDNDWHVGRIPERFIRTSCEFLSVLLKLGLYRDALVWWRELPPVIEFVPDDQIEICDLVRGLARHAHGIAKAFSQRGGVGDALALIREGLVWCDRYRDRAFGGEIRYYHEQLLGLLVDLTAKRAEKDWDPANPGVAFEWWREAWSAIRGLQRLGERTSSQDSDVYRSMRRCLASDAEFVDDSIAVAAIELLNRRLAAVADVPDMATERDLLRFAIIRLQVELLHTFEPNIAVQRAGAVRDIIPLIREIEDCDRRDTECMNLATELNLNCRNESLFRSLLAVVESGLRRFDLLLLSLDELLSVPESNSEGEREFDRLDALLEEALALWYTLNSDRTRLEKLDELAQRCRTLIEKAVEDEKLDYAEAELVWLDRLSEARAELLQMLPEEERRDDDEMDYAWIRTRALANLAVGYSRVDDDVEALRVARDYYDRARKLDRERSEDRDEFLEETLSGALANLIAKQRKTLGITEARRQADDVTEVSDRRWLLHLICIDAAESGDLDVASELLNEVRSLEAHAREDWQLKEEWGERARAQAAICAAALAANDEELHRLMRSEFETTLRNASDERHADNVTEVEFEGWRRVATVAGKCRRLVPGMAAIVRMLRAIPKCTNAEWRESAWYAVLDLLMRLTSILVERGRHGCERARELVNWMIEQLGNVAEGEERDDRSTWLAFLLYHVSDYGKCRDVLSSIDTEAFRIHALPIQAAVEAAVGNLADAAATLANAQLLADEFDPGGEISWLRRLRVIGEAQYAAAIARTSSSTAIAIVSAIENREDRVRPLAAVARAIASIGDCDTSWRLFNQALELRQNLSLELQRHADDVLSEELFLTAVSAVECGECKFSDALAILIPSPVFRNEALWLVPELRNKHRVGESFDRPTNPIPALVAVDRSVAPDAEVLSLVSKHLASRLREHDWPTDAEEQSRIWSHIECEAISRFLGPCTEPSE